jgi:hypothetical protein
MASASGTHEATGCRVVYVLTFASVVLRGSIALPLRHAMVAALIALNGPTAHF